MTNQTKKRFLSEIPTGDLPALMETMENRGFGIRAAIVASEIKRRCQPGYSFGQASK